jgi:hypothetical protein
MQRLHERRRRVGHRTLCRQGAREFAPHGTGTFETEREDQQAYEGRANNPNGNKGGHDIGLQVKRDGYNLIARDLQQSISPVPQCRVRCVPYGTAMLATGMDRGMEASYIRLANTLADDARRSTIVSAETEAPQMRNRTTPRNLDEYISASPAPIQPILKKIRKTIRETAPQPEETISYGMPALKQRRDLVSLLPSTDARCGALCRSKGNLQLGKT